MGGCTPIYVCVGVPLRATERLGTGPSGGEVRDKDLDHLHPENAAPLRIGIPARCDLTGGYARSAQWAWALCVPGNRKGPCGTLRGLVRRLPFRREPKGAAHISSL